MRKLTTRLIDCSRKPGMVGFEHGVTSSGEPESKGISKLAPLLAPLDALLRQVDVLVEAHLLSLISVAGMA
jgi:hypothetical protein